MACVGAIGVSSHAMLSDPDVGVVDGCGGAEGIGWPPIVGGGGG